MPARTAKFIKAAYLPQMCEELVKQLLNSRVHDSPDWLPPIGYEH